MNEKIINEKTAAYSVLDAAIRLSPNQGTQNVFRRLHNDVAAEGRPWSEVAEVVASALLDGLRHGNWPMPRP